MNRLIPALIRSPRGLALAISSLAFSHASADCLVPPPSLVAWWSGDGTVSDAIGNNNLTLSGGAGFGIGEVAGAFSFNGTGAYAGAPASANLDVGAGPGFTIEFWLKPADVTSAHAVIEWNNGVGGIGPQLWTSVPGLGGPGSIFVNLSDTAGTDHYFASPSNLLNAGAFQHVALTYDRTSGMAILYYNGGQVIAQYLGSFTPQTTYGLYLGARISGSAGVGSYYNGLLDEVSVYDRVLPATEIAAIVNAGSAGKCHTPTPPFIFSLPASQTVGVGAYVILNAGVGGSSPLTYQWAFNGTNISGGTGPSLSLLNVQLAQAGTYTVQITNPYGTTNSPPAVLTVEPAPPCAPQPPGLAGWWRGELDGSDQLGTDNATLVGPVAFTPGEVGAAFALDGHSGYVSLATSSTLDVGVGSGFTIEGWIKPNDVSTGHAIAEWNNHSGAIGVHFWTSVPTVGDAGSLFGNVVDTAGQNHMFASSPNLLRVGTWQHVALTYDKATGAARLFLNGVAVAGQAVGSFTPQTSYGLDLGARASGPYGAGGFFFGNLDEISLYSRALTDAELAQIFNAGASGKCRTLTAPFIWTQPADQVAVVDTSTSFHVLAGGTPPLTYQWTFKGSDLDGATGPTLILPNVQMSQAGTYAVVVTNALGSVGSSNATLTVKFPPALIQVADASGSGGATSSVPVLLVANGNENALGFSLTFDTNQLTYVDAHLGAAAASASLIINPNQAANGALGLLLALPTDATFPAGTQELVVVRFSLPVSTSPSSTSIGFADSPAPRQLSDRLGSLLDATYAGGTVTIGPAQFEGDVSPRPNGDEVVGATDWVLLGRYVARLDFPANASEFQRADCAPRSTLGDGYILVNDWVQAGRYAAGLDPATLAGGPSAQGPLSTLVSLKSQQRPSAGTSLVRAGSRVFTQGQSVSLPLTLDAQGAENALSFSLSFDPSLVTYSGTVLGADAARATLLVNAGNASSGHVGYALALPTGNVFPIGTCELVQVFFHASSSATGTAATTFADQPVPRAISDSSAKVLSASYFGGTIGVNLPPALTVGLSGPSLLLSWPLWATNFVLQEAEGPLPFSGSWSNPPVSISISSNQSVVLPLGPTTKFFRLFHP
jgi:hypothetical protein